MLEIKTDKAIILSAGSSKRMSRVTGGKSKSLLEVKGVSILERLIYQLKQLSVSKIYVAIRDDEEEIPEKISSICNIITVKNIGEKNNLYTIHALSEYISDYILISYADIIMSTDLLRRFLSFNGEIALLAGTGQITTDTMPLRVERSSVKDIGFDVPSANAKFLGVLKMSAFYAQVFQAELRLYDNNHDISQDYYTIILRKMLSNGTNISACVVSNPEWTEVDTPEDYRRAKRWRLE